MKRFDIFILGVGGQGVGLLAELVIRAADYAGHKVVGVDTHGLAQRGGVVTSTVRIGTQVHSPLLYDHEADVVLALERHEALRGIDEMVKPGGAVVYYDCSWQPLNVRLNLASEISEEILNKTAAVHTCTLIKSFHPSLPDVHMQNIVVLASAVKNKLIPDIEVQHYVLAMEDLMTGQKLDTNRVLFMEMIH